jgi:SAM-dependent methyltransferase
MICRICGAATREILDLGASPPANSLKPSSDVLQDSYPLVLDWCATCDNVQLRFTMAAEELYRDYLYVTPDSTMLSAHYEYLLSFLITNGYVDRTSFVVEAGSNAGHFLKHIHDRVGRVLGVDPAESICAMAIKSGVPTICDFFTQERASRILAEFGQADLVVARHVLAHNESPHEMVSAARGLLREHGFFVIENAYVLNTIENGEFDQVYHEHMFYFSIHSMQALLRMHSMRLVDVTMSLVHGGSIIFVAALGTDGPVSPSVERYASRERLFLNPEAFARFSEHASEVRRHLRELIRDLRDRGSSIYTYGATAKGNTLLNYVGLTNAEIPYCVDSTPVKQGRFLPMSNIEVISEEAAIRHPPDYFLLTAWNYQEEIITKVRGRGNYRTQFIVPIPFVRIT